MFIQIFMCSVSSSRVQFRAGSSNRETGGSIHPASELVANPDYDYYTIDFDVAVARVSDRICLRLNSLSIDDTCFGCTQ
jgi:hypothetical protein